MDVKGAKALSERLAEAVRDVDPPPAKGRRHCGEGVTAETSIGGLARVDDGDARRSDAFSRVRSSHTDSALRSDLAN